MNLGFIAAQLGNFHTFIDGTFDVINGFAKFFDLFAGLVKPGAAAAGAATTKTAAEAVFSSK